MSRRAVLSAGLVGGLIGGAWDAASVLLENPRSFSGAADAASFLAAGITGYGALGAFVGAGFALLPRRPGSWVLALLLGIGLFAWAGVRVHVRWFFGTPLLDPPYLAVNAALLAASGLVVAPLGILLHARGERFLASPRTGILGASTLALAGALFAALRPDALPPSPSADPPPGARDVLLVTLDTTRADHLSVYGYPRATTPAVDRLARGGVVWTNLAAPIPLTNPSHASLFTGLSPREHGVRNNGTALEPSRPTFVDDLAAAGWKCAAFVSGIPLKAGLSGLSRAFAVYDDRFSPLESLHPMLTTLAAVRVANRLLPIDFVERRAAGTAEAAVEWLRRSRGPRFVWVHFFDPHTPYDAPAPLRRRFALESNGWSATGRDVTAWPIADYDAEIRSADRALARLVREFDAVTGGEGVVVVTADHGEGLEQHGELAHGSQLYTEDLRVPCVVRSGRPGGGSEGDGSSEIRTGLASLTALARLVPAWAHGTVPGRGSASSRVRAETFAPEGRHDQSAIWNEVGRKIVVNWDTGEEWAFDLAVDPGETEPLGVDELAADLREHLAPPTDRAPDELDPEVVRRLRALGYLH